MPLAGRAEHFPQTTIVDHDIISYTSISKSFEVEDSLIACALASRCVLGGGKRALGRRISEFKPFPALVGAISSDKMAEVPSVRHNYLVTAHKPTLAKECVHAAFTAPDDDNLIVA